MILLDGFHTLSNSDKQEISRFKKKKETNSITLYPLISTEQSPYRRHTHTYNIYNLKKTLDPHCLGVICQIWHQIQVVITNVEKKKRNTSN